jgi:hypothetical protein
VTDPGTHNPALAALEPLVGAWRMELSHAAFLPDPTAMVASAVSFDWREDGALLVLRMGGEPPGPANALWLIGRDSSRPEYTVLYYDTRGVSRIYAMTFADGVWQLWRDAPGFSQRFEGRVSADGNRIAGRWEKSTDGATWEHDFDVTYARG